MSEAPDNLRHAVAKACCAGWYAGGIYGLNGKYRDQGLQWQNMALEEADDIIARLGENGVRLSIDESARALHLTPKHLPLSGGGED